MTWSAHLRTSSSSRLADDGDDDAAARLHFLHVRERLLVANAALLASRIARREHDHGQFLVDQRVRSVLHLTGRIAFGVNVGDLLQLQRAFERDREVNAAAEIKKILGAGQDRTRSS